MQAFVAGRARDKNIIPAYSLEELVTSLKSPRKVMLMVKAANPLMTSLAGSFPCWNRGTSLSTGGNSHFADTRRRLTVVEEKGLLYDGNRSIRGKRVPCTARSLMPGGSPAAWPQIRPIFQAIAAKVDNGTPCADWVGPDGSGHFVKMVHNGIEYGDLQLIREAYHLMKDLLGLDNATMAQVFQEWNAGGAEQLPD